jgi:hypothetical protein
VPGSQRCMPPLARIVPVEHIPGRDVLHRYDAATERGTYTLDQVPEDGRADLTGEELVGE